VSAEAHSTGRRADGIGTTARPGAESRAPLSSRRGGEFGGVYSANVGAITTFFARRCTEPQTVADLTSETFVEAVGSFHTFDPVRGSPRGWLFGIARNVLARHYAALHDGQLMAGRLAGRLVLGDDGIDELAGRIDAQREGRELLDRCRHLPELERAAIELVDIVGLTPKRSRRRTASVAWGAPRPAVPGASPRPRTLTLTAGAAGVIAAAVVTVTLLVGGTTSTPPAFALTQNADGTVTVTLNDVAAGIPGLNAEFARLGIRERAVPIEAGCTAGPAVGYMAPLNAPGMNGMSTTFTFSSATEHPGYTGFIAARQVGPDHVEIAMGAMQNGMIPPCFPEQTMQVIPVPESGTSTGTTTSTTSLS
jgi:DNA-directed RNA polymerase specialized sigma24 family protein